MLLAEWFRQLDGGEMIGLVAVAGGLLFVTLSALAHQWRRVRVAEMEAALKQQMLDKGMSAAEIEQVLHASAHKESTSAGAALPQGDAANLVKSLADNGYSGPDIERVLTAMRDGPVQPATPDAAPRARTDPAAAVAGMLDNDMPVEDIERVLRALGGAGQAEIPAAEKAALVEKMASHDLTAEQMERLLHALQAPPAARGMDARESVVRKG